MSDYARFSISCELVRFVRDNNIKDLDEILRLAKLGMATEEVIVPATQNAKEVLEKEMEERN